MKDRFLDAIELLSVAELKKLRESANDKVTINRIEKRLRHLHPHIRVRMYKSYTEYEPLNGAALKLMNLPWMNCSIFLHKDGRVERFNC